VNRGGTRIFNPLIKSSDEMKQMETTAKKPGVVGVSNQWLERHNQIIKLKVQVHDLELQIAYPRRNRGKDAHPRHPQDARGRDERFLIPADQFHKIGIR
jgi:hypothetical protein